MREFFIGVASTVAVGILGWLALTGREAGDRSTIYAWLKANTRDEPGESHSDTVAIAKGTGLADDRVRRACMSDKRIHRAPGEDDSWSVWRAEPESIYERRGMLVL
jgi:hypothetical protein